MTLETLYNLIGHYTSKHYSGQTLTPELLTTVLAKENTELFYGIFREIKISMEQGKKSLSEAVSQIGGLEPFLVYVVDGAVSSGVLDLEDDYFYYDVFYLQPLKSGGLSRPVEVVLEADAQRLKTSMLSRDLTERPIAVIDSKDTVKFTPTVDSVCNYSYLREPATPFYDYCISVTTNVQVYMPVGSKVVSALAGYDLQDSVGNVLEYNVEHLTATAFPYTSQTVELEWKDTEIIRMLKSILLGEGISLRDSDLFQMVKADES